MGVPHPWPDIWYTGGFPIHTWAPYWSMKMIGYRVKAYSSEALENAMFPE
jgi:hypothetical protein